MGNGASLRQEKAKMCKLPRGPAPQPGWEKCSKYAGERIPDLDIAVVSQWLGCCGATAREVAA